MNYEQTEQRSTLLADGLDAVATILADRLGLADEADRLRARARQVREDRFRVLVVGEFKRGKSTLLNALLGDDVLPRKVAECTAVVTLIRYGDSPGVRVVFSDGRADEELSVADFRRKYELALEDTEDRETAMDRFSQVDHAILSYPVELCRHRVELVDSPGLGAHKVRAQRTQKFLPQADAVIFVLFAPQFLREDEKHFLEAILLPLGLRNVFFVINGWNLIEESVLRPEDTERERTELEGHIRQRLVPFCFLDGQDRSAERIFRVNALGALKARMRRPQAGAMLEESNVPPFEEALQNFLVEDRGKARHRVVLTALHNACLEVDRYIATQVALAGKSIAEIEAERAAVEPKLERLRGIRQHILNYLDSQSANLQDRLVVSFQDLVSRIEADLPAEVEKFDLSDIKNGSMVWAAATDWARSEENKFAKRVERCIKPQVQRLLERRFAVWQQSILKNEMRAVLIDVDKYLQEEAAEYQRVLMEIEDRVGIHASPLEVRALVDRWLGQSPSGASQFALPGSDVFGDMSWLITGIAIDVVTEVFLHMAALWIPFVGLIVTGFRLWLREGGPAGAVAGEDCRGGARGAGTRPADGGGQDP
jgi:GTPase SAR1 family protein